MKKNTTPIINDFLEDLNLSYQEKMTYILLMKFQRFGNENKSFCSWLNANGLRGKTFSKYLASLIDKDYIKEIKKNNYYFYAKNRVGEIIDYNGQDLGNYFKSGVSFVPVSETVLFSDKLSLKQKLVFIFLERELNRSQVMKKYKINFQTIENDSGMSDVRHVCQDLQKKGFINYEIKYFGKDPSNCAVDNLEINYDLLDVPQVEKQIRTVEPVAAATPQEPQQETPIEKLNRILENQEIEPMEDQEPQEQKNTWDDYLNGYCSEPPKNNFQHPWSIWDNVPGRKNKKNEDDSIDLEELFSMI